MNSEQARWFKRLERCLKEMPKGVEILAHEMLPGTCDIHIFETGEIGTAMDNNGDCDLMMNFNPRDTSMSYFRAKRVSANNHGY